MDFQVIEQSVGVSELLYEGAAEQPVDADITLPDYCPDVQRILKCMVYPRVQSVQTAGDRVTADGSALVRVLYVSEAGKIYSHDQSYPFSKYVEGKGLDGGTSTTVRASAPYVNSRAVSPRRVDVHGMLSFGFRVQRRKEERIISGAEGGGIQMKKKIKRAVSAVGDTERAFPLTEVIELEEGKPSVGQMLHTTGAALLQDVRAISNKLLLKGELALKAFYIADSPEGELCTLEHSIPISQIIELEGVEEEGCNDIRMVVSALELLPKSDASGERRLLDISARVCAEVSANREVEIPIVIDAYSTQHELRSDMKNVDFLCRAESFSDTFTARGALELAGTGAERILGLWCGELQSSVSAAEGELRIQGSVMAYVLFRDAEAQAGYAERPVDFTYKRALTEPIERLKCSPDIQVLASGWVMGSDGTVDLKVEMKVTASAYAVETDRILTAIEPDETREKKLDTAALTIYFSDAGEAVWDIARRYNTTVEAIVQENRLSADTVEEKRMLLIPGVR